MSRPRFPIRIHFRHGRIAGLSTPGTARAEANCGKGGSKRDGRDRACFSRSLPFTRDRPRSARSGGIRDSLIDRSTRVGGR